MQKYLINLVLFLCTICSNGQRLPPGVSPQHYQQQVPQYQQQQYQHVPQQVHQQQVHQQQVHQQQVHQQQVHQQQIPQHQVPQQQQQIHQQQQMNQQFQQVPVQQHQVHEQQVHHAHGHPQPGQILNAANIAHEKEHIAEHMEIPIDTSKMSEQELQFHYFKMHDADNNNKLDGCELIKSLIHWHEQGSKDTQKSTKVEEKIFQDDELVTLIDPILTMDDSNQDGYIDYPEFIRAQQKAAAAAANKPK